VDLDKKCDLYVEIQLIAFKCKVCRSKCPFGRYIIEEYEKFELENYHYKMETE